MPKNQKNDEVPAEKTVQDVNFENARKTAEIW